MSSSANTTKGSDLSQLKADAKVLRQLASQNALHGMFGEVFLELGGKDFLKDWAREHPDRFITLLSKMTPNLIPQHGMQGDVNITINNSLGATPLDDIEGGEVIDHRDDDD